MSLVQIREIKKELVDFVKIVEELEKEIQDETKDSMFLPEDLEVVLSSCRGLDNYISFLSKALLSALNNTKVFNRIVKSQETLTDQLEMVLERVKTEQPDSPLIENYYNSLVKARTDLIVLEAVRKWLGYPKSKKKFRAWMKKGLIPKNPITYSFGPFMSIRSKILDIRKQLGELVDGE